VGSVFLEMIPFLPIYTEYVNNYTVAVETLQTLVKKNSSFASTLNSCGSQQFHGRLGLESLMIVPIQRIPRYRMLLGELLNLTSAEHADYCRLTSALQGISEMATYINEKKRDLETQLRVSQVAGALSGSLDRLQDSVYPGGMPQHRHEWHKKHFSGPTWCTHCHKFIYGVGKQGFECRKCKFAAHKTCYAAVRSDCGQERNDSFLKHNRTLVAEIAVRHQMLDLSSVTSSARKGKAEKSKKADGKQAVLFLFTDSLICLYPIEAVESKFEVAFMCKWYSTLTGREAEILDKGSLPNSFSVIPPRGGSFIHTLLLPKDRSCDEWVALIHQTKDTWRKSNEHLLSLREADSGGMKGREGYLAKLSLSSGKKHKRLWAILQENKIVFYRKPMDIHPKAVWMLLSTSTIDRGETTEIRITNVVSNPRNPSEKHTVALLADSVLEADEWSQLLRNNTRVYRENSTRKWFDKHAESDVVLPSSRTELDSSEPFPDSSLVPLVKNES